MYENTTASTSNGQVLMLKNMRHQEAKINPTPTNKLAGREPADEGVIPVVCDGDKGKAIVKDNSEEEDQHSSKGPSIGSGHSANAVASKKIPKWYMQTMKDSGVSNTCHDLSNGVMTRRQQAVSNLELNLELNYALMVADEPKACIETKKRDDEPKIHQE
eukprot:Gb_30636 [translate_table: standard]